MLRSRRWYVRRAVLTSAFLLTATGTLTAVAAGITWETRGAFEACLEDRLEAWVSSKAVLVAKEDPAAGDLDDMDVALWAVTTLQACEAEAGRGSQTSEQRFSQHMAHWRDHINKAARSVRAKDGTE